MYACKMLYNSLNYTKINCFIFLYNIFVIDIQALIQASVKFDIHIWGSLEIQDVHLAN